MTVTSIKEQQGGDDDEKKLISFPSSGSCRRKVEDYLKEIEISSITSQSRTF